MEVTDLFTPLYEKKPDPEKEELQDDRGGLGSAPAGAGNQGVSARGYRTAGIPTNTRMRKIKLPTP